MRYGASTFEDFRCAHCGYIVSAMHMLSGVNNRNHCPYCLWSCHLDHFSAGDRLSACKGKMMPMGLTMKRSRNKYRPGSGGELMLIHECMECNGLSINRIAADDDSESILALFQGSQMDSYRIKQRCEQQEIELLGMEWYKLVYRQLYGQKAAISIAC